MPQCDFCTKEAVARIGLPSNYAQWACIDHFNEWRNNESVRVEGIYPKKEGDARPSAS